jgi:restriction system protein
MSVWLTRAGRHGEHEQRFILDKRVYVTWDDLCKDLTRIKEREELFNVMGLVYPDAKPKTLHNWVSQIWPFVHEFKNGDLVVLPLKTQPSVYIGEVTGDCHFELGGPNPYFHWRPVKWIAEAIPRSHFGQDILYSFGAFLTICRIKRNNAEVRIEAMRVNGWKPENLAISPTSVSAEEADATPEAVDLEQLARDQIARLISANFKGHGLALLVEAILKAQGYTTYRSPEGADGGVDILAGAGPLGFGTPQLCVQVKSQDTPVGRPEIDQLMGTMKKVQAHEALFVSWSGFKPTVYKEIAPSFFSVRLWNQKDLLQQLFAHYDHLDEDLKAELPLKRIWTIAAQEED